MTVTPSALPKTETGVEGLLAERPDADGRGTICAVMDTGCDLGAAGLQTTSDGKNKYIDFIDCTGGGDVDMSKKAKVEAGRTVTGISGRTLTLGPWIDGVEEVRVGAVRLFALGSMPTSVLKRIKSERKEVFAARQHQAIAALQRKLDGLESGAGGEGGGASKKEQAAAKKDAQTALAELEAAMDKYADAGPLMDVVLYQEAGGAGTWRAVLDLEAEGGDLSAGVPMAPYAHEQQVGSLGFGSALSYCVQVYAGGDLLSLVSGRSHTLV